VDVSNLTHEHLDYHVSMDAYLFDAKARLFEALLPAAVRRGERRQRSRRHKLRLLSPSHFAQNRSFFRTEPPP